MIEIIKSLRLVRTGEDLEKLTDRSAPGVCGKCRRTFPMSELGYIRGFYGLICKKCRWADFRLMVAIAIGVSIVLGVFIVLAAKR